MAPTEFWIFFQENNSHEFAKGSRNNTKGSPCGMIEANRAQIYVKMGCSEGAHPQTQPMPTLRIVQMKIGPSWAEDGM
jgi:hypothetical protein